MVEATRWRTEINVRQVVQVESGPDDVLQTLLEDHMATGIARINCAQDVRAIVCDTVVVALHIADLVPGWGRRWWNLGLLGMTLHIVT